MMPKKIVFGANAAKEFEYPKNSLIITTTSPEIYEKWTEYMGITNYEIYDKVTPDPSIETIEKIKNGDYQSAESLVIEAYLDNFEFLEGEIAKHDESLLKDTEVLLREQLRNLIQGKASLDDIQKMVDNINTKLNEIEKLLQ